MKRILFLIILGWAVLQGLKAQKDAALSHYFMATAYYNPAAAGSTEDLKMLALFNRQWVGFPNAQQSFFVTADMPLKIGKTNHGIGIAAYTESILIALFTSKKTKPSRKERSAEWDLT